jgi:hypothetical protein
MPVDRRCRYTGLPIGVPFATLERGSTGAISEFRSLECRGTLSTRLATNRLTRLALSLRSIS